MTRQSWNNSGGVLPNIFLVRQIKKAEEFVYNDEEPLDKTNTKQKKHTPAGFRQANLQLPNQYWTI